MTTRRLSRAPWLVTAVVVVLAAGCSDSPTAVSSSSGPSPSSTCAGYAVDAATGNVVCKPADGQPVVNEQPQYATPKPGDFKVAIKVLEKQCFGSAGCNITYRIDPQYTGAALDPAVTWLVTYEVRGVEDGPQISTFELTGADASIESEEIAQTPSSKTKLTVRVTDVLPG